MNNETIFRAIGQVGDDLIVRAGKPEKSSRTVWLRWTALAACCALVIGMAAFAGTVVFKGAKSAAPESAAGAQNSQAEEETITFDDALADAAPAERPEEEAADAEMPMTQETSKTEMAFRYDGRVYCKAPEQPSNAAAEASPGEMLGTIDDGSLAGCEIFLCPDAPAEAYVLVLLDGEYVLFRAEE